MRPQRSLNGGTYYSLNVDVILLFGLTELKAQISWQDKGVEMRSPASIVQEVSKLFEPSVQEIIAAFEEQRQAASMPITCAFLVGGFAASDWLYTSLMEHMCGLGVTFCRPSQHVNKAVADGAVSSFIDHLVFAWTARFTYGTECNALYNEHDPEHVARKANAFQGITGCLEVPNAFESILEKVDDYSLIYEKSSLCIGFLFKGTEVSEEQEFKKPFMIEEFDLSHCGSIQVDIVAYRGKLSHPCWVDAERDSYTTLCSVRADTSKLAQSMQPYYLPDTGATYYSILLYVVLLFGLTELKAQISWMDKGWGVLALRTTSHTFGPVLMHTLFRSPAAVVYEDTLCKRP
ncbi:hypothetical protein BU15DRAFT_78674 [Melanogaster broomeanus]|nr:hypothetical protein BU15DRAFT_78674 [Melanogaster broomeanus]